MKAPREKWDCPCINQGFACVEPWDKCEKCKGTGVVQVAKNLKTYEVVVNGQVLKGDLLKGDLVYVPFKSLPYGCIFPNDVTIPDDVATDYVRNNDDDV